MRMFVGMLRQDMAITLRTLRRSPGFAIAAVATLALGIGANTAIFSLISHTLLEPLPYPDADRIVQLWLTTPEGGGVTLSIPEIDIMARETGVFESLAAFDFGGPGVNITGTGEPEQVKAIHVSADYFRLFGASVEMGRTFTSEEDRPNGGRVVVLSHELWRRRFGSDRTITGKAISLGNQPYTVVGVLGSGFRPDPPAQLWFPLQAERNSTSQAHYLRAAARLRQEITIEQANARLKLTTAEFLRKFPLFNPQAVLQAKPLRETNVADIRAALLVLFGTVILVLLIACSNVANLLLARATARQQEIAIRAAIGASRSRLMLQLLTECSLLALAGGVMGLIAGRICLQALLAFNPEIVPGSEHLATLDWRVLLFVAAISFTTTITCGMLPALRASRTDLAAVMQESGSRTGVSRGTVRVKSMLVIAQVALAVVLAVGAGLMIRTFAALRSVESGIDPHNVLTLQMSLEGTRFSSTASITRLVDDAVERLERIPGVKAAASTWTLPVELAFGSSFIIEGRPLAGAVTHGGALMRPVSPNFASVFGIRMVRGRFFTPRDTTNSASVAVISEAMAKKFWPDANPIGERITLDKYLGPDFAAPPREIIGIAASVRDLALNKDPSPMVYIPQAQVPNGMAAIDARILPITWAVRTVAAPYSFSTTVQAALREASGGLAVAHIRSMEDVTRHSTLRSDFQVLLLTVFAGAALVLAAIGIYGLIAFSVQQRTRELGIRLALGATPHEVQRMVVWQGLALTAAGVVVGAAASVGLARYMASMLYGVKPLDLPAIAISCAVLGMIAMAASYLPARRAARLDPVEVLRSA